MLEQSEDPTAVVIGHDDREIWPWFGRAEDQAVRVVQKCQVAEQRVREPVGRQGSA